MSKRKRNYKAEYERRLARAAAKGLSKSQARGHRKASEAPPSTRSKTKQLEDHKLQMGLRMLRKEENFSKAARHAHISPERLRRYAIEKGVIKKRGRRWVLKDDLPRQVPIYSNGKQLAIIVGTFKEASTVAQYMAHTKWFLRTQDLAHLRPFVGVSVTDINRKSYVLETRPRVLYRLSQAGNPTFEQVYRIAV